MPTHKDEVMQRWWPLTDSLDLVRGSCDQVAQAVLAEVTRFISPERPASRWLRFTTLDELWGSVRSFSNGPTIYFVLPTASEWTVLWNNSFLCDGYASLCWCLTTNHSLTTIHWRSSDSGSTFQAGSTFNFRRKSGDAMIERSVECTSEDGRWLFMAKGDPLPEEDLSWYTARHKRDRLNEARLMQLFESLGARPWAESFYALARRPVFRIECVPPPATVWESFEELQSRVRKWNGIS